MTFEQIFGGRMVLMGAQRHIAQAGLKYEPGQALFECFTDRARHDAFFLVERLLCDLEREFDDKQKRLKSRKRRRQLDRRAQKQVTA